MKYEFPKQTYRHHFAGFTLVELIVSMAIIGVLIGISLPGVQMVREAARRSQCQNKLKNIGLALLNFESVKSNFPHGAEYQTEHAWGSRVLPFLEEQRITNRLDFKQRWDANENFNLVSESLDIFACPSSDKVYPGKTDYCGISGSWRNPIPFPVNEHNGMLFPAAQRRAYQVDIDSVTDGTSHTIIVSEGASTGLDNHGFWADGLNCFSHDSGGVNAVGDPPDEIVSGHASGANAALVDGSVQFIGKSVAGSIVAAMCTRNGEELVAND